MHAMDAKTQKTEPDRALIGLPLHKTTDGLKHIKKARDVTNEHLPRHTCEVKTIPDDDPANLMRECHECAKMSSKLNVATLDDQKYKTGLLYNF